MTKTDTSKSARSKAAPKPASLGAVGKPSLASRLSAPTTLIHELGGIAYTTAVAPLVMLAFAVMGRR